MACIGQWEQSVLRKGEKKGKAEGKAEGKAVGMHMKALEIAKNLLREGIALSKVATLTRLPLNEIKHLKVAC